jgi:hypothetical protein
MLPIDKVMFGLGVYILLYLHVCLNTTGLPCLKKIYIFCSLFVQVTSCSLKYVGYCLSLWNICKLLAIFYKRNRLERDDTEKLFQTCGPQTSYCDQQDFLRGSAIIHSLNWHNNMSCKNNAIFKILHFLRRLKYKSF